MTRSKKHIQIYVEAKHVFQKIRNENPFSREAELMLKVLDILCVNAIELPTTIPFAEARKFRKNRIRTENQVKRKSLGET